MPPRPVAEHAATGRERDPERTRNEILDTATREFAEHGYAGARVDDIAERMRTTKRMIYYYFGSKEQLFIAVLERAYAAIRAPSGRSTSTACDPAAAVRRLAELTFDHHESHPGVHPAGEHREHPPRRAHGEVAGDRGARQPGDRPHRPHPRARPRGGRSSGATSTPSTCT